MTQTLKDHIVSVGQELPQGVPLMQCGAPGRAWLVVSGFIDFFMALQSSDGSYDQRIPLGRIETGGILFDLPEISLPNGEFTPIFTPGEGTRCLAFDARKLALKLNEKGRDSLSKNLDRVLSEFTARMTQCAPLTLAPGAEFPAQLEAARRLWRTALSVRLTQGRPAALSACSGVAALNGGG